MHHGTGGVGCKYLLVIRNHAFTRLMPWPNRVASEHKISFIRRLLVTQCGEGLRVYLWWLALTFDQFELASISSGYLTKIDTSFFSLLFCFVSHQGCFEVRFCTFCVNMWVRLATSVQVCVTKFDILKLGMTCFFGGGGAGINSWNPPMEKSPK